MKTKINSSKTPFLRRNHADATTVTRRPETIRITDSSGNQIAIYKRFVRPDDLNYAIALVAVSQVGKNVNIISVDGNKYTFKTREDATLGKSYVIPESYITDKKVKIEKIDHYAPTVVEVEKPTTTTGNATDTPLVNDTSDLTPEVSEEIKTDYTKWLLIGGAILLLLIIFKKT